MNKILPQVLPWIVKTARSSDSRRPDQDRTISDHDSNHCDIFTDCVHHSKCPHYLEQSEKLKTVSRDTSEYTRIRGELRQLICNQKERKVCCEPSTFSPTSARPNGRPTTGIWSIWHSPGFLRIFSSLFQILLKTAKLSLILNTKHLLSKNAVQSMNNSATLNLNLSAP